MATLTKFVKAQRVSVNTVEATYSLNGTEFTVEWNNIHPATGKESDYDLQLSVGSDDFDLAQRVSNAIGEGETDSNPDLALYLEVRDTFDRMAAKDHSNMDLSYNYDENVIGYIVTDKKTNRSVNFQFEKAFSNHPTPDFVLSWGVEGDDTCNSFTENELEEITDWLRAHDDVDALEDAYTAAFYGDTLPEFTGTLYAWEILESAEKANP